MKGQPQNLEGCPDLPSALLSLGAAAARMADANDGLQQGRSAAKRTAECTLPGEEEGRNVRQKVGGDGGEEVDAALQLIRDTDGVSLEWHDPEATRQLQPLGWTSFYKNVLSGAVVPTCVIDFPFADRKSPKNPHGLDLQVLPPCSSYRSDLPAAERAWL